MTPQWFLKGEIILLILFMSRYCEANNEEKEENIKYLEGLGLSRTAKDEKAFQMVKEHIKDVLKKEEGRTFYTHDEGPRKYFYKKYMKLGKNRDGIMDYDSNENRNSLNNNFEKSKESVAKSSEKNSQDSQELSGIAKKEMVMILDKLKGYSQGYRRKIQNHPTMLSSRISDYDKYSKENYSQANNFLVNTSLKNEENFPNNKNKLKISDENYKWINDNLNPVENKRDKYLDKRKKSQFIDYSNTNGINGKIDDEEKISSLVNSISRTYRSLKGMHYKKKRKCYRPEKKISENKNKHESNGVPPNDHRKVRSCDIKMEDLRESFIPNEQLSIYHPKMSLSDQFILQDTMF